MSLTLTGAGPGSPGGGDPLAGIDFALRLHPTIDGVTPYHIYQDTACTVPAVTDGHLVQGWKDPISGLIASQANSMFAPILRFRGGVPCLEWGTNKFMTVSLSSAAEMTAYASLKPISSTPETRSGVLTFDIDDNETCFLAIGEISFTITGEWWGSTIGNSGGRKGEIGLIDMAWSVFCTRPNGASLTLANQLRRNGIQVGAGNDTTNTCRTDRTILYLGRGQSYLSAYTSSMLLQIGTTADAEVAVIESYINSLAPTV